MIFVDSRHYPVIIATWIGTANLDTCAWFADWYDGQLERATKAGEKIVSISDTLDAQRPPPEVRKFFADWMNRRGDDGDDATVGSIAIIPNPLMRGALTAVGWVNEKARAVKAVATMSDAIHSAHAAFEDRGHQTPSIDTDTYVRPTTEDADESLRQPRPTSGA